MPQFAVYANPGRNRSVAYLVQVQSTRCERNRYRVVMALAHRTPRSPPDHDSSPHLTVQGRAVYADAFDIATILTTRLGPVLDILPEPDQDRVMRALDEMISRA